MFDKTWFYIEDASGNAVIDGVKCKLLCELKNGKSTVADIGEGELKLFAVSGDFDGINSQNGYAYDVITIGAGTADAAVSGKRYLNPARANSFEFDR